MEPPFPAIPSLVRTEKSKKAIKRNGNKKQQQQALAKREQQIRNLPTIYTFNFKDVPAEQYIKPLENQKKILKKSENITILYFGLLI